MNTRPPVLHNPVRPSSQGAPPAIISAAPVHALPGDPAAAGEAETTMKPGIHPEYGVTTVTCTCGNTFTTRSTAHDGVIH